MGLPWSRPGVDARMGSSLCAVPASAIARVATPRTLTAGSDRRSGSVVSPGAIASARVCSDVFSKMKCPVPIWRVARVSN